MIASGWSRSREADHSGLFRSCPWASSSVARPPSSSKGSPPLSHSVNGLLMGPRSDHAESFLIQIVGIILPALNDNLAVVLTSAALYGGSFIGIVSLVLAMAGRFYPTKPAKLMGRLTLLYGIAQIGAPAIAGIIADRGGSYADSLYIAAAISVLGAGMILILKAGEHREQALKTV